MDQKGVFKNLILRTLEDHQEHQEHHQEHQEHTKNTLNCFHKSRWRKTQENEFLNKT